VGEAELKARPIAKPKLSRTKANADAAIAPAIAGPHVKPELGLTIPCGVSESGIMLLASSANLEMKGSP
jgi:hypothetical protein